MTNSQYAQRSMVIGSLAAAVAASLFYLAHQWDPAVSGLFSIWVRVCMNGLFLAVLFLRPWGPPLSLWPPERAWLWIWGVLGALTVVTYFISVQLSGPAVASLLNSTFGIFATALAPMILGSRTSPIAIASSAVAALGLVCLLPSGISYTTDPGAVLGLLSGLFTGLAYLAVAKSGTRFRPTTTLFFWTLVCFPVTTATLPWNISTLPSIGALAALMGAGLCAALSQYRIADAYQRGPVEVVSALSYLAPFFALVLDSVCFDRRYSQSECAGAVLILVGGTLPYTYSRLANLSLAGSYRGGR